MAPAKTFKEVELVGQVREIVTGSFTVNNPLNIDVTIPQEQVIIENEYLTVTPDIISIPAESEVAVDVSFRPLVVGKINTNVTIKSSELGELKYPISIEGTPAPPQTLQPIQACLGSDKIIQVSFTHFIKKPATYTIKVDKTAEVHLRAPSLLTDRTSPSPSEDDKYHQPVLPLKELSSET